MSQLLNLVRSCLPAVFANAKINVTDVLRTINTYLKRVELLKLKGSENFDLHCLIDWVLLARSGDQRAIGFLDFIDSQVHLLFSITEKKFHPQIARMVKEMLTSIDPDVSLPNNPSYLNYVGEIIGLSHILSVGKGRFSLIAIEKELPNRKKMDFVFVDEIEKTELYVDFVSIHHINPNKLSSDRSFVDFLEDRFNRKIESKTVNLPNAYHQILLPEGQRPFTILPIIWTETVTLLPFIKAFSLIDEKYANVFSCCSVLPQQLEDGKVIFRFSKVSVILETWQHGDSGVPIQLSNDI